MRLPYFHERLLTAARPTCARYGLLLAGGYAMRAHGLVERPSQDLDFATNQRTPLPEIADDLVATYQTAGMTVDILEATPRSARLLVRDPVTGDACEVDLLKEALQKEAVTLEVGPVVHLDDAVAMKTRALADRGFPRDFIDVCAAAGLHSPHELERLARRQSDEFSVRELATRLGAIELIPDRAFESYGLDEPAIGRIRQFALDWLTDIRHRRVEDGDIEPGPDPDDFADYL